MIVQLEPGPGKDRADTPASNLALALRYADLGWRVVPLEHGEKKPHIQEYWATASSDPATLEKWFGRRWPDAGVGILTGREPMGLDFDAKSGGLTTLERLAGDHGFPDTAMARSPGGGVHLYYRAIVSVFNRVGVGPGFDIRGRRGIMVVEPSVRRVDGRMAGYTWIVPPWEKLARWPARLASLAVSWQGRRATARDRDVVATGGAGVVPPMSDADVAGVLIGRYGVEAVHCRNDPMVRSVASLLSRGFDDDSTVRAVELWWRHYHDLGKIATDPAEAPRLIQAAIRSIRRSPGWVPTIGVDHLASCRRVELSDSAVRLMGSSIARVREVAGSVGQSQPGIQGQGPEGAGVGRDSHSDERRLCKKPRETAFVEALIVHAIHKIRTDPGELIRATNDQIVAIAADRHPDIDLSHPQKFERLKEQYISRPGDDKPATRFELLTEVEKGNRRQDEATGKPSVYRPTGIMAFLDDPASRSLA